MTLFISFRTPNTFGASLTLWLFELRLAFILLTLGFCFFYLSCRITYVAYISKSRLHGGKRIAEVRVKTEKEEVVEEEENLPNLESDPLSTLGPEVVELTPEVIRYDGFCFILHRHSV